MADKDYQHHIIEKDDDGKVWFSGAYSSAKARDEALISQKRRAYPNKRFAPVEADGVNGCFDLIKAINKKNGKL